MTSRVSSTAESVGAAAETARDYVTVASESASQARVEPEESATVYVGNLFFDITAEDLRREFSKAGDIGHAKIIYDTRGLSKG